MHYIDKYIHDVHVQLYIRTWNILFKMNATQQQGTHTPHSTSLNMRNTNKNMTNMKTLASGEFKEMKQNKRVGKSMGQYVPWIVLAYLVGIACVRWEQFSLIIKRNY